MSKIFKQVFFILIFLTAFIVNPIQIFAQSVPDCSNPTIQTDPPVLKDTDSHGEFIIDVDRTNQEQEALGAGKRIVGWKAEFECAGLGVKKEQKDATNEPGGKNIRVTLDQNALPFVGNTATNRCEFDPKNNPISVLVKATYQDTGDAPRCRARYNVYEAASFCQLDINPKTGITVNSDVDVIVMDKASGPFDLFMDSDVIAQDVQISSTYRIPRNKMIQGPHAISLRKYLKSIGINENPINRLLTNPFNGDYGPPICPFQVTIGTLSSPGTATPVGPTGPGGTAVGGGTGPAATPCTGANCTKAGGDPCKPPAPSDNPGFNTAIGCIHTSPAAFVKDFLTFIIAISGGLAFLMMLLGAFQMLTSAGNPETLAAGKDRFTSAIIGLLFVIFAVLLMQIIGYDILRLPGFGK